MSSTKTFELSKQKYGKTSIKRIEKELKRLVKNKKTLEDCGIYFNICNQNFGVVRVMIIGQKDTPYHHGFYFFTMTYSQNHPFEAIKVIYEMNKIHSVRMNPNLYVCGKVCLSLINTWYGEGWLPTVTIDKVMLAICSDIINKKHPLYNEPGQYSITQAKEYNLSIFHQNFHISIYHVLKNMLDKKPWKHISKILLNHIF